MEKLEKFIGSVIKLNLIILLFSLGICYAETIIISPYLLSGFSLYAAFSISMFRM